MSRRSAKRVLAEAAPRVSADVVVISTDYFATSMSVADSRAIEANLKLINEATKMLRRAQRAALAREKRECSVPA